MPFRKITSPTEELGRAYFLNSLDYVRTWNRDIQDKSMTEGKKGNYGYPHFAKFSNVGQPFHLVGTTINYGKTSSAKIYQNSIEYYVGSLRGTVPIEPILPEVAYDDRGAEAYSKMKPTTPDFSGFNFLYELREIPEMLMVKHSKIRHIGNYFLALKFGWEPLLADIRNLVMTQLGAQKRLNQLIRDNGRPVRRRVILDDLSTDAGSTSGVSYDAFQPILTTGYYAEQPTYRTTRIYRQRLWASAQFRFWLPEGPRDIVWKTRMMGKIFGLDPSPADVWNALPWTWLIDWFAGVGTSLENHSSGVADSLAADYLYLMRHQEMTTTQFSSGRFHGGPNKDGSVRLSATSVSKSFTKQRIRGNPFGFKQVLNTDLSDKQLAILGALGLSRT